MSDEKRDEIKITRRIGERSFAAVRRNDEGDTPMKVRVPQEGEPLPPGGELLSVDAECKDGWHSVDTVYKSGPPQVVTPKYREGWDRIFGKKPEVGLA